MALGARLGLVHENRNPFLLIVWLKRVPPQLISEGLKAHAVPRSADAALDEAKWRGWDVLVCLRPAHTPGEDTLAVRHCCSKCLQLSEPFAQVPEQNKLAL